MKIFYSLFLCVFSWYLCGQNPHLRHFGVDEGLPSSHIYRVSQDSRGYVWICTDKGLVHFDGYSCKVYGTHSGLPYNDFWEAKEDSKGRIWFSTYGTHFVHYDYKDKKFHIKQNKSFSDKKSQTSQAGVEDKEGNIWYVSQGYLTNVDRDTTIRQYIFASGSKLLPYFIYQESINFDKPLYMRIVWRKNMGDKNFFFKDSFLYTYSGISFISERNYMQYNGIEKRLYFSSKSYKKSIPLQNLSHLPIPDNQAIEIHAITENEILINTHLECFVIDTLFNRLSKYDFLKNWNINSICADNEGNRWVCTKNNGLFLLTLGAGYSHTFSLDKDQDIRAITGDNEGRIWFGTSQGDVFYAQKDKLYELFFKKPNKLNIRDMVITNGNSLLTAFETYNMFYPLEMIPSRAGVMEMDWASYTQDFDCNIDTCKTIYFYGNRRKVRITDDRAFRNFWRKKNGDILFSTPLLGKITHFSDSLYKHSFVDFNINKRTTACVPAKEDDENIWVGTTVGLFFYWTKQRNLDSLGTLRQKFPILKQTILDIVADSSGNIWVATDGFGLYRLKCAEKPDWNMATFDLLEVPELRGKIIKNLFIDSRNHIWAATNQGAFEVMVNAAGNISQVKAYSIAQGLPTNEVNAIYANDEYVFIGTSKGLTRMPLDVNLIYESPLLDLQIEVNGKAVDIKEHLQFSSKENNLRFNFVCLSFKSDKNIRYYFRMRKNGEETEWQTTRAIYKDFPLLGEGEYVFEVKAEDVNGKTSQVYTVNFSILPPWWRNPFFQIACFIIFLLGVWAIYRWQLNAVNKVNDLKLKAAEAATTLQKERAESGEKAIVYQKKIADLEAKTLLSQMNPHFIFNVLTSIQSFILDNEPFISHSYLTRFAKLIRAFLTASREKYIPIEKEFEMLRNYIDLEKLRFQDLFEYEIWIDEETDSNIEIPPMFIQPFVENAINHGLKYKGEKGVLQVSFLQENENMLLCVIEDNGIGRAKAKELQENSLRGHRSLALKIIEDRIHILENLENWKIILKIIDKADAQGKPAGTRVELHFPIK